MVDMEGPIARLKALQPLHDPGLFALVHVIDFGWAIGWPGGADFSADSLWRLVLEQSPERPATLGEPLRAAR